MKTPIPKRPSSAAFTARPVQKVLYEAKREGIDLFSLMQLAQTLPLPWRNALLNATNLFITQQASTFPCHRNDFPYIKIAVPSY